MPDRGDAYEFVLGIPGSEFLNSEEIMHAADLAGAGLDSIHPGMGGHWWENGSDFDEFMDYMGLDYDSPIFWEAFREWYGDSG